MRHRHLRSWVVLAACGALFVTSCSGDGSAITTQAADSATTTSAASNDPVPTTTTEPSATSTTTTEPPEPDEPILALVPVLTRSGEEDATDPPLDQKLVARSRDVTLSPTFVDTLGLSRGASTVTLDLFADASVTARGAFVEQEDAGFHWKGKDLDGGGDVLVVVRNGEMTAHVSTSGGTYEIRPLEDGRHSVVEFEQSAFIEDGHLDLSDYPVPPPPSRSASRAQAGPVVIDVLVVWTTGAQARIGGADAMLAEVDLMVLQMNTAFENSGMETRVRLVGARNVGYQEPPIPEGGDPLYAGVIDLMNLTCVGTSPWSDCPEGTELDRVHQLRDDTGADLVSMIMDRPDFGGLGWGSPSPDLGFTIVDVDTATWSAAFAHELAHNLAAGHDRFASHGPGPSEYSQYAAGHVDDGTLRTVMSYWTSCSAECPLVLNFSNPSVSVDVDGVTRPTGAADENNARVIDEVAPQVAAYRDATVDADRDGDGVPDTTDVCPDLADPDQIDTDGDGTGDACDVDDDDDGLADADDAYPLQFSVCDGRGATILGTPGDDTITGTNGDDVIVALAGNDRIEGLAGNDRICAGAGDDEVYGGRGHDIIEAGSGEDLVYGDGGADQITGGANADELFGGDGNDTLTGNGDDDTLRGEAGDDALNGGPGNDKLWGEAGDDQLFGNAGRDQLRGGDGVDELYGGQGDDWCTDAPVRLTCERSI